MADMAHSPGFPHPEPIMTKPRGSIADLETGPAVLPVPDAGAYIGLSRSGSYDAARRGVLPTIKVGPRRLVVPATALKKLLEGGADADADA